MKKLLIACFVFLMLSTFNSAAFLILKIEERVKNSNLIVTGKLVNVSQIETENSRILKGTLVIEKVIYGNFANSTGQRLKSKDEVKVEWRNSKMMACKFGFAKNKEEIWLLTVDSEGTIESLSPGTTASLNELTEVKKHLKKQKRKDNVAKKIKLQNDAQEIAQSNLVDTENTVKCLYSTEIKPTEYSPVSALFAILTAISLYYLLYRSRFKIR